MADTLGQEILCLKVEVCRCFHVPFFLSDTGKPGEDFWERFIKEPGMTHLGIELLDDLLVLRIILPDKITVLIHVSDLVGAD